MKILDHEDLAEHGEDAEPVEHIEQNVVEDNDTSDGIVLRPGDRVKLVGHAPEALNGTWIFGGQPEEAGADPAATMKP